MLKQILLKRKAKQLETNLQDLLKREEDLQEQERKLAEEIETSTEQLSDEAREAIEETADEMEKTKADLVEEKVKIQAELDEINKKLAELDSEEEKEEPEERQVGKIIEKRGDKYMGVMNMERREQLRDLIQNDENKRFFEDVKNVVLRQAETTLTKKELLIPEEVFTFINQEVLNYGEVINLVHRINLKGKGRIVFNAGTPTLQWTEACESLQEATLGEFKQIELDNFKLGGYVFLCKAFVEDAIISIADYIIKEFAYAIAVSLDNAIINGTGTKQPEGITKVVTDSKKVKNILGVLGLVGDLNERAKNITLVTNRKTYYQYILPETYGKDSNGKIVYGLGQTLPDGTKIVISNAVKDKQFIVGDFYAGYKLGIRKEMTFDSTDQVRWIEEQIGYKTSGRYDGKVADKTYFALGEFEVDEVLEM